MMKNCTWTKIVGRFWICFTATAVLLWTPVVFATSKSPNFLRDLKVKTHGSKTVILVKGTQTPSFTAFKLSTPFRLVIDIPNSQIRGIPSIITEKTKMIDGISVSEYSSRGMPVCRLMINISKDATYKVRSKGKDLLISFDKVSNSKPGSKKTINDSDKQLSLLKAKAQDVSRLHRDALKEIEELKIENTSRALSVKKSRLESIKSKERLDGIKESLKKLQKERDTVLANAKNTSGKVKELEALLSRLEGSYTRERREKNSWQSKVKALENALANSRDNSQKAENEKTSTILKAENLQRELMKYKNDAWEAKANARNAQKAQRMAQKSFDKAEGSLKTQLEEAVKEKEKKAVYAEKKHREIIASLNRVKNELGEALKAKKAAAKRAQTAKTETNLLSRRSKNARRKLESELKSLKEDIASKTLQAKKSLERVRIERDKANQKLAGIEKKFASTLSEKDRLKNEVTDYEQKIGKLEKELSSANLTIATLKEENSSIKKKTGKLTQEEKRIAKLARLNTKSQMTIAADPVATNMPAVITDIKIKNVGSFQKVVISSSAPIEYSNTYDDTGWAVMTIKDASLSSSLERTLDIQDLGGVLSSVSSYEKDGRVVIEVDVERTARNNVTYKKNSIEWAFSPMVEKIERVQEVSGPSGTKTRTLAREDASVYSYPHERTSAESGGYTTSSRRKRQHYSGRRIDLDFKSADIHNILRLLSDVGHVNIITGDDVKGTVTIRMRDVAWDKALDVILQAKKLGMIRDGNLIRVAPMSSLEKEREMEIARKRQKMELEPLETRLIPVSYAKAGELQPRAVDLLSNRGKVSVDSRTNVIIARDTKFILDQVEVLIRNLDTQTPQVLIESRIVEATSVFAREMGIQWGGDFSASAATGNPTGLAFPSTFGIAGGSTDKKTPITGLTQRSDGTPNPNFAVNMPAAAGMNSGGSLGITLGSIANNANLNIRLSAMEEEGTLRILSSPKILTLDNREAHIEQGTLIPYSQISAQGIQTMFKEAKLNLTVTPHVTADGSILLSITVNRDEPDWNNKGARGDPTILKREAQTELLISDGHTAVIGGIFTRNHGYSYKKVPFLADIPLIGWLFRKKSTSDRRSEMLIFITPRIVNRSESIGQ